MRTHANSELVFAPTEPKLDESMFERKDWSTSEFGDKLTEKLPDDMPPPRGCPMIISAKVDADHASDGATRRSRTGFSVFLNSVLMAENSSSHSFT